MTHPEPDAAVDRGVLARAVGIIFSPGATFAAVVRAPRPAGILFLVCLVMALAVGLPQFTERGRQAALDMQVQQIERFTSQPVTPEAYAAMEQRAHYGGYITFATTFIVFPIFSLLFGALYWVFFNAILGGTASFKQVLGIITHSQVITALGALVSAPIQYIQGTQSAAGPFNLGALAPMLESGSLVANVLGAISFFTLWQLIISAIGLAVLYRRRAGNIALGLITVYIVAVGLFTAAFSSFTNR